MTPQYILRASLCRPAHCYSSHVVGEGWVGKPDILSGSVWQAYDPTYNEQRMRKAEREIDNLTWAEGYAGYTPENQPRKGVLLANWNVFPSEAVDLLERYGYEIEWSDEWCMCENCGLAIRTEPDSHWFRSRWSLIDNENLCVDCVHEYAIGWLADVLDAAEQVKLDALEILDNAINYIQHSQDWDAENFMDTIEAINIMLVAESKVRRS